MLRHDDVAARHEVHLEVADVEVEVARHEVNRADALVEQREMPLHRTVDRGDLEGVLAVLRAAVAGSQAVLPRERVCGDLAGFPVGGDRRTHLLVRAGVGSHVAVFACDHPRVNVVGLRVRDLDRDRVEVVDDPSRRERSVEDAVLKEAEVEVARLACARRHPVDGARLVLEVVAGVRLHDHRRGRADLHLGSVVAELRVDDRDGLVLHLLESRKVGDELLRGRHLVVGVAHLAPRRPAVLVGIGVGVVARAVEAIHILFEVLHEVVVGVELAEVDRLAEGIGGLHEVVGHVLGDGVREGRVERDDAVDLGDAVFLVVGKAVVVGVGDGVVLRAGVDAVHVLPPVGDAVVVEVAAVGELGIVLAVGEHAAGEVAQVGGPRRHDDAVVVDGGVPADPVRRVERVAVVVARVVGPPVGQAVEVLVGAGLGPGVGRRAVIPHAALGGRDALRVGAAERQQVEALLQAVAHGEGVRQLHVRVVLDPVPALVDRSDGIGVVQHLAPAAPRLGRPREGDLRVAELRGKLAADHVLAPVLGVGRGLVEPGQVVDGVGDPGNPRLVVVDGGTDGAKGEPPLAPPVDGTRPDRLRVGNPLQGGEAGRALHDDIRADAAGHVVERPVALQLGGQQALGGGCAIDDAGAPDLPDRLAVGERVVAGIALAVVGADFVLGARAVPDPDLVDIALVEIPVVAEGGGGVEQPAPAAVHHDAIDGGGRSADQDGDLPAPVDPAVQAAAGTDRHRGDAVLGTDAGLDLLVPDAVDVEIQVRAVVCRRDMRPVGGRGRAVENLLRGRNRGAGGVEHRVPAAVLDADEEVLPDVQLVAEVRRAGVDRALDERLVAHEVALGLGPALDGEVEERQVLAADDIAGRILVVFDGGLEERVRAREPHRLAAERRVGILRVGGALRLACGLVVVGDEVVVGVVALVLLEGPGDVEDIAEVEVDAGDRQRRNVAVDPGVAHEVVELVLLLRIGVFETVGRAEDDPGGSLRGDIVAVGDRGLVAVVGHP